MANIANSEQRVAVDRLVALIDNLKPFLDTSGRCCCRLPHAEHHCRPILPIKSSRVESWLVFKYREEHGHFPHYLRSAVAWVEGKLLANRTKPSLAPDDPTLRCFLELAFQEEIGAGSATEILESLDGLSRRRKLLASDEKLPSGPVAMGIWLRNNQETLLAFGIELKSSRSGRKRIWHWQSMRAADDTCPDNPSSNPSQPKSHIDKDMQNRMTDDEIDKLLRKVTHNEEQATDHAQ